MPTALTRTGVYDPKLGLSFYGNRMAPITDLGPYAKRL